MWPRCRLVLLCSCLFLVLSIPARAGDKVLQAVKIGSYQDKTRVVLRLGSPGFYELSAGPETGFLRVKLYDFHNFRVPARQLVDERLIKAVTVAQKPQFLQVEISLKKERVSYQGHLFKTPPMLVIDIQADSSASGPVADRDRPTGYDDGPLPAAGAGSPLGAGETGAAVATGEEKPAVAKPQPDNSTGTAAILPIPPPGPETAGSVPEEGTTPAAAPAFSPPVPETPLAKTAAARPPAPVAASPGGDASKPAVTAAKIPAPAPEPASPVSSSPPSGAGRQLPARPSAAREAAAVALYQEGLQLFQTGDYARAREVFNRLLQTCPRSSLVPKARFRVNDARLRLARERQEPNLHQVIDDFLAAVRQYPDDSDAPWALLQVARAYEDLGFTYEAEGVYRALERQYPDSPLVPGAIYAQAKINFALKRYRQAATLFRRLLVDYPHRGFAAEAAYYRANCHYYLADYERAMSLYDQARQDFPAFLETDPRTLYLLGSCYLQLHRPQEAHDCLLRLRNLYPRSDFTNLALAKAGQALLDAGKIKAGLEILSTVVKEYPDTDGEIIARLTMAGLGARHDEQWRLQPPWRPYAAFLDPVAAYEGIVSRHGDQPLSNVARLRLGLLYLERRKYAQARKYFDQLLDRQLPAEIRSVTISSMKRLLRDEARELFQRHDYAALLALQKQYGAGFLSRPAGVYPFFWFAEAMRHEGLYRGALELYPALQACKPARAEMLAIVYGMADCHQRLGEDDLAAGLLDSLSAYDLSPDWQVKVDLLRARVAFSQKNFPFARRLLEALAADAAVGRQQQIGIQKMLGQVYAALGERPAAARAYRRALSLVVAQPQAVSREERFNLHSAVARFQFASGHYRQALAAFEQAALLSSDSGTIAEMLYWQSLCHARLENGSNLRRTVARLRQAYPASKWSTMAAAVARDFAWQTKNRNLQK